MLQQLMPFQITPLRKNLQTLITFERLPIIVYIQVRLQAQQLIERLRALITFIRLRFRRMYPLVHSQRVITRERLRTSLARMNLIRRVRFYVHLKRHIRAERLRAQIAIEHLLLLVQSNVHPQLLRPDVRLVASRANVRFFNRVLPHVQRQRLLLHVAFRTELTDIRFLVGVPSLVHFQRVGVRERLRANDALEEFLREVALYVDF